MPELGYKNSMDEVRALKLYKNGLVDEQIADALGVSHTTVWRWRKSNGLQPNSQIGKNCIGCRYWRSGSGAYAGFESSFCHHLLDTNKRRVVEDGECKSYTSR